ncbi:hypothetical protein C8F04DRAFT_1181479 [Mycena alexandri]|uniref:Uncharacterized protein n=1 Tax=Mycena alexandri TaxID=1745969 RepID=A0AAD6SZ44_9AGAR|nr:hypothetical protein C8F04DRAFT_1181479 [Mycena alexandri]
MCKNRKPHRPRRKYSGNSDERNEKTKARMARLRAHTSVEERAARRRASDEAYRIKNRALLAANARAARQRAADTRVTKTTTKAAEAEARRQRIEARGVDRARWLRLVDTDTTDEAHDDED